MATQTQTVHRLSDSAPHLRFDPYARPERWPGSKRSVAPPTAHSDHWRPSIDTSLSQPYPLPLRPSDAAGWNMDSLTLSSANLEHQLRRKTPSGTLTAAYDGTPVDSNTKPPAMKHLLLPLDPNGSNFSHSSTFPQANLFRATGSASQYATNGPLGDTANNTLAFSSRENLFLQQPLSSGPSSIPSGFNTSHVPNQPPLFHLNHLTQPNAPPFVANVMQPPYQAHLGPTVSNDLAPYGPYWPNGVFAPYRPAAIRDPRFHLDPSAHESHRGPSLWSPSTSINRHSSSANQFDRLRSDQPYSRNPAYGHPYQAPSSQNIFLAAPTAGLSASSAFTNSSVSHHHQHAIPTVPRQSCHPSPLDYPNVAIPRTLELLSQNKFHEQHQRISLSQNAAELEELTSWALSIYTSLVTSIQQAKKSSVGNDRQSAQSSVNIYPEATRKQTANTQRDSRLAYAEHCYKISESNKQMQLSQHSPNQRLDPHRSTTQLHSSHGHHLQAAEGFQAWPPTLERSSLGISRRVASKPETSPLHTFPPHSFYPPPQHDSMYSSSALRTRKFDHTDRLASNAFSALNALTTICYQSHMEWIDGMLLAGCLAYVLGDYQAAVMWYSKILELDAQSPEALSNLAATYLALDKRREAEEYWRLAVEKRPGYFEAAEHLVGLLCSQSRQTEAVQLVDTIQACLKRAEPVLEDPPAATYDPFWNMQPDLGYSYGTAETSTSSFRARTLLKDPKAGAKFSVPYHYKQFIRKYAIPLEDNGRLIALIHAKGNILYNLCDHLGAATAFEEAVLIAAGRETNRIDELIDFITLTLERSEEVERGVGSSSRQPTSSPLLLTPERALQTARQCFLPDGVLPGLTHISSEQSRKAAVSITSNSLLSLAKIFQDSMSSTPSKTPPKPNCGVRDILALYYLSLSLQPSPSTANNVGILLASVQQSATPKSNSHTLASNGDFMFPGVIPGSGIALALMYYQYGLNLDSKHAHLFTNLGSLLKDIGQLSMAIKMYEKAVSCDGNFDIALANLANAVKDQGRTGDAITYYKRAVNVNPNFAEAVCGLANALNSICNWSGRGGVAFPRGSYDRWHVDERGVLIDSTTLTGRGSGWTQRVIDIVDNQLLDGESWGLGILSSEYIETVALQIASSLMSDLAKSAKLQTAIRNLLSGWSGQKWEGARTIRFIERAFRCIRWQCYQDMYVNGKAKAISTTYERPQLPSSITVPGAPTVLPFHTFTFPMTARQIRLISQRNGLRMSCSTLRASWLSKKVWLPPPPPSPTIRVGYVSSDFNNHPLAHLMQSVFGMHDRRRVETFCYATTASDNSAHRLQIEKETPVFLDVSSWSVERIVKQIHRDGIHILVNLNGYTRGARNEIFAARPAPVQMSFMGFAGTLGAEWCDYILADELAAPPRSLRPWRRNVNIDDLAHDDHCGTTNDQWVYSENIVYTRNTFFCCDHRQSASSASERTLEWESELSRRWKMRKELFPQLSDDTIILANFNQLYKIDPTTFRIWLRILSRVPNAVLWLLRFPDLGEAQLLATARAWGGADVAQRIIFTDVAPKPLHIARACVADLFIDTPECNAHTTAADCLWSGTPLLTHMRWPWKMCSRMAAGILRGALTLGENASCAGTGGPPVAYHDAGAALPADIEAANKLRERAWRELVVESDEQYEETAVRLCRAARYNSHGRLAMDCRLLELRRMLWTGRWDCVLFDTRRWVRELEKAYAEVWRRWVDGEGGDIWLKDL